MTAKMMHRFVSTVVLALGLALAAPARAEAPIDTLFRVLGLPETIEIMREEGLQYGAGLQKDLLGGRGGARWMAMVDRIYDLDRMTRTVRDRLDAELAAEDLAPMIDFFASERGQNLVKLENAARRALLDDAVEEASRELVAKMRDEGDPRLELLDRMAQAGDLIENNVVGALNSNYAFYVGLAGSGNLTGELSEEEILADVWGQEESIRADTTDWLYGYLALAYQPVSDEDLKAYVDFWESDAGRALNQALFAAFDEMFTSISLALGKAAGQFMGGEDL